MHPVSVGASAPAAKANQPGDGAGRTLVKALVLVSTLLSGGLMAEPVDAGPAVYPAAIRTTGTITSGSESGGLFGLPVASTSLAGDSESLTVRSDRLGPNHFTTGPGTFAEDFEIAGITTPCLSTAGPHDPLQETFGSEKNRGGISDA